MKKVLYLFFGAILNAKGKESNNIVKFKWKNYTKIHQFISEMQDMNYIDNEQLERFYEGFKGIAEDLFCVMGKDAGDLCKPLKKLKNIYISPELLVNMKKEVEMDKLIEARKELYTSVLKCLNFVIAHGDILVRYYNDDKSLNPQEYVHVQNFHDIHRQISEATWNYTTNMNTIIAELKMGNTITKNTKFKQSVEFLNYLVNDQTMANIAHLHKLKWHIFAYHRLKSLHNPIIESGKDAVEKVAAAVESLLP